MSFTGVPENKKKAIAALRRGENAEENFDSISCTTIRGPPGWEIHVQGPDLWEEEWDGDEGTVAITQICTEERGDHGGHPRTDIMSVKAVSSPLVLDRPM